MYSLSTKLDFVPIQVHSQYNLQTYYSINIIFLSDLSYIYLFIFFFLNLA